MEALGEVVDAGVHAFGLFCKVVAVVSSSVCAPLRWSSHILVAL